MNEFVDAVRCVVASAYPDILETHRLYQYCFVMASLPENVRRKLWQTAMSRAFIQEGKKQCAVTCIQAVFRRFLVRKFWSYTVKNACLRMQSSWRIYLARTLVKKMKKSRDQRIERKKRIECVSKIQRFYRVFQKRKQLFSGPTVRLSH